MAAGEDSDWGKKMNRRNVLGNKIEQSKTTWVVLIGIFVTALQFVIFYFLGNSWLSLVISALLLLLGSVGVHLITGELGELFAYLLIPCSFAGSMGVMIPTLNGSYLPESGTAFLGCLFAWLVPVAYACIYTWAEGNSVIADFAGFYLKANILFYVVYFGVMLYGLFFMHRNSSVAGQVQLIPFATFAAYVDGVINETVPMTRMVEFLMNRVVFFIPYGFFVAMVCRKLHGVFRLVLLLIVPLLVEVLQFVFRLNSCDADDVVFAFLGGLVGMLAFLIFNKLFQSFTGKNFDASEVDKDYYGRKI